MTQSMVGWAASITALIGAALIAMRSPRLSKWGFVAFLASNLLWIGWGIHCGAWELVCQNVGFLFTSVAGISTWFGWLPSQRSFQSPLWLDRLTRKAHLRWQYYCLHRRLLQTSSCPPGKLSR